MPQTTFLVFEILTCFLFLIQRGHAYEFKVGGSTGWILPTNAALYNQWAERNRFQIGDTLLFVYDSGHDSVLRVTTDEYESCNTGAPLEKFADGNTVVKLDRSGPHYFISGVADNCRKNEKLAVVVMADRRKSKSNGTAPAPAPAGEESPPSPGGEMNPTPTPAPAQELNPPRNGAGSGVGGVGATVVGVVGSLLVLCI